MQTQFDQLESTPPAEFQGFPPILPLRFEFEALDRVQLPAYPGSAWRGLLGSGLRHTVCVTRQAECRGCLLLESCVYATFFETKVPAGQGEPRYSAMPHPFVLVVDPLPAGALDPGERTCPGINLLGDARRALPYLVHTLEQVAGKGVGSGRGSMALRRVAQKTAMEGQEWRELYTDAERSLRTPAEVQWRLPPAPSVVRIELLSPLRIKHHGHLVGAAEFTLRDLVRPLQWRLERLDRQYGQGIAVPARSRFADLEPGLRIVSKHLRWHDWTRYSSRQHTLMQMGGLLGDLQLEGPGLTEFWPYLWLGQWTHLGKGTSMGLGRYRVTAAGLPDRQPEAGVRDTGVAPER